MKISQKYAKVIERIIVAFFMTQVVSFAITAANFGFNFTSTFLLAWIRGHLIALSVGIPVCLLLSPIVEKLIKCILIQSHEKKGG